MAFRIIKFPRLQIAIFSLAVPSAKLAAPKYHYAVPRGNIRPKGVLRTKYTPGIREHSLFILCVLMAKPIEGFTVIT